MLNKTFLLGCAIAFLTACGGSDLELGPNNPDYGKPIPDPVIPPTVELDWDFDFEDDAQATVWEDRSGGNMSADFAIHGQQTVLGVNAHDWTSGANVNDDNLAVIGMLPGGARDVRGGVVYMSIFLPAFYTDQNPWNNTDDDGPEDDPYNFGFNVTAEDINGNEINVTGWKNVYEFLGSQLSTLSGLGYSQRTPDPAVGDVAGRWFDLTFNAPTQVDDGFDASQMVGIGFSLARDGVNTDLPSLPKEDEYIYLDNILVTLDPDFVPPVILDPAKESVDFVLPVYLDSVESGFGNTWADSSGTWSWNDSIVAAYDSGGELQIDGPEDSLDISGYTNFHMSVYGEDDSGTSSLDIALCDCDDNYITVEVEGGEWTDLVIPVADFMDISLAAIRVVYEGPDARTFFIDNVGFDLIEGGPGGEQSLSRGWAVEGNDGLGLSYGAVSYTVQAADNQLNYVLAGPVDLTGATASFMIDIDQAYIDSGASLQPYAQAMFGDWVGQWDCNLDNADLKVGGVQIDCLLSEDFNIPEGENVKLAILAKGDAPVGVVTVTGLAITMAEGVPPAISLSKGWAVEGDDVGELAYREQVTYSPVLNDAQLNLVIDGPVDMSGATILFDIAVSQAFIDSGAAIQPYAQAMFGDWAGQWDCNIDNASLTTTSTQYTCALGDTFNIPNGERIKVAMLVKGDAPAGSVTVTRTEIILATELLPLAQGWAVEGNDDVGLTYGAVSYSVLAADNQLNYAINGPIDLTGATVTFEIAADQAYIDSGAFIQPYAQAMFGDWVGQWDCNVDNADLTVGGMQYSCALTEDFNIPEGERVKLALLAKGDAPAGVVTISSVSVAVAGGAAAPAISLSKGWAVEGDDVEEASYSERVTYTPLLNDAQINFVVDGPINLTGGMVTFNIAVSQAFIDSGSYLQPYAQAMFGDWVGQWDCNIDNAALTTIGTEYECALSESFDIPEGERVKIAILAKGDTPAGSVTIYGAKYKFPASE